MNKQPSLSWIDEAISRRGLLRGGAAAAALAVLSPFDSAIARASERARSRGGASMPANVRVCHDRYGVHIGPSVVANPRHPHHLLAACQASHTANPRFIATYLSFDGGASWQNGGVPPLPPGANGDDVTVAFDAHGRGYVCGSSYAPHRAIHIWRTDDGGRHFSAPLTVLEGEYYDHPWIAAGGQSGRNVYVAWAAGSGDEQGLRFMRSTDGTESFQPSRMIMESDRQGVASASPQLVVGAHGLVCAVCIRDTRFSPSGDLVGEVVAVCSTDAGKSFGPPARLGTSSPQILLPGNVKPQGWAAAAAHGDALYVAFTTHRPGATHADIVATASHDGGRTWSKAVTATPADGITYFQPNLAVDAAGRIGLSAFALANGRMSQALMLSRPGVLRFGPPLRVSPAFDPHSPTQTGQKFGAWWIGDNQGITASGGAFHLVWNDTRTGKLDLFAATVHP